MDEQREKNIKKGIEKLNKIARRLFLSCPKFENPTKKWERISSYLTEDVLRRAYEQHLNDFTLPGGTMLLFQSGMKPWQMWEVNNGRLAAVLFRLQNCLYKDAKTRANEALEKLKPREKADEKDLLNWLEKKVLIPFAGAMNHSTHCFIGYTCEIGPGLTINHGTDIYIAGGGVTIGENFKVYQGTLVGVNEIKKLKNEKDRPTIGNNVTLGARSQVVGPTKIGNGCIIGAGTTVASDLEDGKIVCSQKFRTLN